MREQNICCIQRWENNAKTELIQPISETDTQILITPGSGSKFPNISDNQFFLVTIINPVTCEYEIVKVIDKSDDAFTVIRGQEETVPRAFPSGSKVELRLTAETLNRLQNLGISCIEYVYVQSEESYIWEIQHNLDCYPNVLIFNERDEIILGGIEYVSDNVIRIHFDYPVAGKAILTSSDLSLRDKIIGINEKLNDLIDKLHNLADKMNVLGEKVYALGTEVVSQGTEARTLLEKIRLVDGSGSELDADKLDGYHASDFAFFDLRNVDNSVILNKLKIVDGHGSGLDADTVDGQHLSDLDDRYVNINGDRMTGMLITPAITTNEIHLDLPDTSTDPLTIRRWQEGADRTTLEIQIGDNNNGDDKLEVTTYPSGNRTWLFRVFNDGNVRVRGNVFANNGTKQLAYNDLTNISNSTFRDKIKAVDGSGSGIDADLWDGGHKHISTSNPSGGQNGDIWFKVIS